MYNAFNVITYLYIDLSRWRFLYQYVLVGAPLAKAEGNGRPLLTQEDTNCRVLSNWTCGAAPASTIHIWGYLCL